MAKHTRKQFAALCGVKPKYINTYVSRDKIIVGSDKLIDDTVLLNSEFLLRRLEEQPEKKKKEKPELAQKFTKAELQIQAQRDAEKNEAVTKKFNLEVRQKELILEEQQQKVDLNKIKLEKQRGEVIPTELANLTFAQHFKSVTTAFYQGADNFIGTIATKYELSIEERAVLRGELKEVVNKAVAEGIESSKNSIENIAKEYSTSRARGEKK